jgi:hypothetical protein
MLQKAPKNFGLTPRLHSDPESLPKEPWKFLFGCTRDGDNLTALECYL